MTLVALILVILTVICLVVGQLIIKHAMSMTHQKPLPWRQFLPKLTLGVTIMTMWFLLWIFLLQSYELSYLFPFDSLSTVLLSLGAMIFLKEKLTLRLWVGMILIVVGVMFVAHS